MRTPLSVGERDARVDQIVVGPQAGSEPLAAARLLALKLWPTYE